MPIIEITPLVVVKFARYHWVVYGNRRLRALKEYAAIVAPQPVMMRCIVHDFDSQETVDKSLLAKFLDSATTTNNGISACFRKPLKNQMASSGARQQFSRITGDQR